MTKEIKNNSHPEGGICELIAYTPKLGLYRNNSDMNELSSISVIIGGKYNEMGF